MTAADLPDGSDGAGPDDPFVPETEEVTTRRISCDGGGGALGHPLVWLSIGPEGYVDCGYCDKRFILKRGAGGH